MNSYNWTQRNISVGQFIQRLNAIYVLQLHSIIQTLISIFYKEKKEIFLKLI